MVSTNVRWLNTQVHKPKQSWWGESVLLVLKISKYINTGRKNLEHHIAEGRWPLPTSGWGSVLLYLCTVICMFKKIKSENRPKKLLCMILCLWLKQMSLHFPITNGRYGRKQDCNIYIFFKCQPQYISYAHHRHK